MFVQPLDGQSLSSIKLKGDVAMMSSIDRLVAGGRVLEGLRHAGEVAAVCAGRSAERWAGVLSEIVDGEDQVAVIGALHAMSGLAGGLADEALGARLDDERMFVVQHAAWALSGRSPHRPSMVPMAGIVGGVGGFTGMLAQRTLEGWAATDSRNVAASVRRALAAATTDAARSRLVETLGLTRGADTTRQLEQIALDDDEGPAARLSAVSALGDRTGDSSILLRLAARDDELAERALLAVHDRQLVERPVTASRGDGVRIGQVFVHTDFTGGRDRAGAGDDGGISALLSLVAEELGELDGVADVVSIGRGGVADALLNGWPRSVPGGGGAAIPFGPSGRVALREAWPYRVEIERGMRRVLRSLPGLDLLHLRMADVGTLAAARVARRHGLPIVFTAAPDPHAVLEAMEATGELTRAGFGDDDLVEHWWFRARMVERLALQADRIVLLPRPDVRRTVAHYLGSHDLDQRSTVVAEGVHAASVRRARTQVDGHALTGISPAVDDLAAALHRMPRRRRRLPLVVSVGRLHPSKGMTRVVRAWLDELAQVANLVIVGGDLDEPSLDEQRVLDEIRSLASVRDGLVLLGRRPHLEVATLLEVAAGRSRRPLPCGVYVAGAAKEEFGLAIVEALAAGLPVVAPAAGGPATYVTDGVDGVLVHDPGVEALAAGLRAAFDLAEVPGRGATASAKVLATLTIEQMAVSLRDVYAGVVADRVAASS